MAINFPTSLDSLTNPITTNPLNSPSHAGQHSDANDAIEALETKVGINNSTNSNSLDYKVAARKVFHGVIARPVGASNPLPTFITTTTFTLGATANPISYYYQGILVNVSSDKTTVLSGAAGLYFIYFDEDTGNILSSTSFPGFSNTSNVIIATVTWNGSNYGLVNDERHGYTRDSNWHVWAHNTIGTRYRSGITLTHNGGTGAAATFSTTAGEIADEDIQFVVPASSAFPTPNTCRLFYQTGATTYAFISTPSTTPGYLGANNRPNYVNSTGYALTQMTSANNRYINVFVYATTSLHTPIYAVTETVTAAIAGTNGYTSLANARAIPFPNLSGTGLSEELKPLYRLIWRADGVLQAIDTTQDDYRTVTSIPQGAGTVSTTASAVTFNPSGNIAATTVQTAIEELDSEKAPLRPVNQKTSLVDADEVTGNDSAASFGQIRTTWTNVKAFLKTYFDTLYATISQVHYVGTTSIAANRASAAQSLTGITSIDGTATNLSGTPTLPNGTLAATQSANDNSTKIATTAYTDAKDSAAITLTTKRINPRLVTSTSYTTDTGTALSVATCDQFEVTAQAGALKFNNPGGTPLGGQKLIVRIKDNGTARALTYDTQFRAMGNALPTTTILSKTLYMGFIYNATDTKWDLVAVAQEA